MIGKLLGHTQVQTTARYANLANDPVKTAAGRVSDTIGAAMLRKGKKRRRTEMPRERKAATTNRRKAVQEETAVAAE
jgi:hypothetical protein